MSPRPPKPISKSGVFAESYCNFRPLERCANFRNMQKCPFRLHEKRLFEKLSFGMVGQSASSGRPRRPYQKKTCTPLGRNQRKFPSSKKRSAGFEFKLGPPGETFRPNFHNRPFRVDETSVFERHFRERLFRLGGRPCFEKHWRRPVQPPDHGGSEARLANRTSG